MKTTAGVLIPLLAAASGLTVAEFFPSDATVTTITVTPFAIEGLTGDDNGVLYTTGRAPLPTRCPLWRIDAAAGPAAPVQIGSIPNASPG